MRIATARHEVAVGFDKNVQKQPSLLVFRCACSDQYNLLSTYFVSCCSSKYARRPAIIYAIILLLHTRAYISGLQWENELMLGWDDMRKVLRYEMLHQA